MKALIFQPGYPGDASVDGAKRCIEWMEARLAELQPGGQDIVLLPEFANAPGLEDRQAMREFAGGRGAEFVTTVSAAAKRLKCLVAMGAVVQDCGAWLNRTLVFASDGELACCYDKLHLTDAEKDDLGITPGNHLAVFEHGNVRIGFATCFDLYFAEHFAMLAEKGVDIVLCPSYQRSESAERIGFVAQARALDSGAYLLRSSYSMDDAAVGGRSLAATPEGKIIAEAGKEVCVIAAEFDAAQKFVKPASHGRAKVEHGNLIATHRRAGIYRGYAAKTAERLAKTPYPHICAHRGVNQALHPESKYVQACPENTLVAFGAAMAIGAHEIELDVQMSKDNVPVICHDPTVDRTTNGSGAVKDLTWAELSKLDAGVYLGPGWAGVRIPTLEEVLEFTDGRIMLNIHIGGDGTLVRRVCDLVRQYDLVETAYLAINDDAGLQAACDYAPEISRACLAGQRDPAKLVATAEQYDCQRVQFFLNYAKADIERAHKSGIICNMFYADDPQKALECVEDGMDVILTNCANILLANGFEPVGQNAKL